MSNRNFPSFLEAYERYAADGFCPDEFHKWIGISILAAALERKVTLKQGKIHHVPNLYVMLVSHPAVGKSTAMDRGVELIEELRKSNPKFRIIPNQATEPALIDMMKIVENFPVGAAGTLLAHSSGYFYASEASASALQNTCGDFVSAMTAFYDCPKYFRKKLKGDQFATEIENACMNMLAGATFNYLQELVNERSVMGGFASRLIYVVNKDRKVRSGKWDGDGQLDTSMKAKLIADLIRINKLAGPARPTTGFITKFEKWQPEFDKELIALDSEKRESILSRKGTHLIKLSILLSVSESDDLIITEKHFDQAKELIDRVTADNDFIIGKSMLVNKESQSGANYLIVSIMEKYGGRMTRKDLNREIMTNGNNTNQLSDTVEAMLRSGILEAERDGFVKLNAKSEDFL